MRLGTSGFEAFGDASFRVEVVHPVVLVQLGFTEAAVPKSQQVMEDPVAVEAKRSQIPKSCSWALAACSCPSMLVACWR